MGIELVGKLTPKVLGWDRTQLGLATADTALQVKIATIVGVVTGLKQTVNNDTGEVQSGLKGNFRGVSTKTKKVLAKNADGTDKMIDGKPVMNDTGELITITSGVCYLPSGIQDMLEGELATLKEKDPKATVSFGIDLFAIKDTNKAGYTFRAETKLAAEQRDPLDMLMLQAQAPAAPALEAPSAGETGPEAPKETGPETNKAPEAEAPPPAEITGAGKAKVKS